MSGTGPSNLCCSNSQCDRLERSLTTTAASRWHLLDALLAEALAPVPLEKAA